MLGYIFTLADELFHKSGMCRVGTITRSRTGIGTPIAH